MEPFGARLDIEIIDTPLPVAADRTNATNAYECSGEKSKYIHFILNQRTVPLGLSFEECGNRTDGWCDLPTFLKVQEQSLARAEYEYACFGNYSASPFGQLTDGVPPPS